MPLHNTFVSVIAELTWQPFFDSGGTYTSVYQGESSVSALWWDYFNAEKKQTAISVLCPDISLLVHLSTRLHMCTFTGGLVIKSGDVRAAI